jgi:hypothetical protein
MTREKTPAHGLHGQDRRQGKLRDTRGGTYDPPDPGSNATATEEHRSPRQDKQPGADVRPDTTPSGTDTLPEGLRRRRSRPLSKTSGRNPQGSSR